MISRIYVTPKTKDSRERLFLKSSNSLGLKSKIKSATIADSYLIEAPFESHVFSNIAEILTNPVIEKSSVEQLPNDLIKHTYLIEIGFLPGVTDNVGSTAIETIKDFTNTTEDIKVFSSKIFAITGTLSKSDLEKIAFSLHNPLIERSNIYKTKNLKKYSSLPKDLPEVSLQIKAPVSEINLEVSDEELKRIGRDGIKDKDGSRRGPLALDLDQMKVIKKYFKELGRNPKDIELESLAQTWSEHCKHTIFANPIDEIKDGLYKHYIKGATNLIRKRKGSRDFCISVFSDNSGGIVFDDEYMVTHKVETHNSPSALDPFGGAITGIVGVNRDTIGFGLGAKPIANTYGFCFGNPEDTRPLYKGKDKQNKMLPPKRIMEGVIEGVNVGGNCSGIPTVSGFVKYDDRYRGKPLVFVGTVGLMPRKINGKPSHIKKAEPGDYIVMVGGRVGKDGIHGATFSSVKMDAKSPATAVQIGDPITQKKLSDVLVKEARDMNLYHSITDNGAGGLSCSVAEMAKECGGAQVDLEKVPLKYPGLSPWQIWISESQERMTLSVPKKKWEVFRRLMDSRGVEASIIGEFTNSGRCIVRYFDNLVMDIDLDFLHNGLPSKNQITEKIDVVHSDPLLPKGINRNKQLEKLLINKNISGFSFISDQYDHEVQASSVLKPLSGEGMINTDAQVFRPVLNSDKGVVLSASTYPSYGDISTYHMSSCAIDTAIRNIVSVGGSLDHLAILDNFCWCSSNEKHRLGQLKDSVKACYDYAVDYSTPLISGKDSMFNDFKGFDAKNNSINISIPPTLLISAIGVMKDIKKTISPEWKKEGDVIYLLGDTYDEMGGSEYFKTLADKNNSIGNHVPEVDARKNIKTYLALEESIDEGLISSSLSLTSGGLAVALAKACVGGRVGAEIDLSLLSGKASLDGKLFSESQGRILVSVDPRKVKKFEELMKKVSVNKIGVVGSKKLRILNDGQKVVDISVSKLHSLYHSYSNSMR